MSEISHIAKMLAAAKVPEDVFGDLGPDRLRGLTVSYRKMIMVVHPDHHHGTSEEDEANRLFAALTEWRDQAERKVRNKTYGDRKPVAKEKPKPTVMDPQVIKTRNREYTISKLIAQGDLADVYACAYREGHDEVSAVFKIARSPADNDLMEAETKALGKIFPAKQEQEKFYRYLPRLLDTFMLRGAKGSRRRVNIIQLKDGYVPLTDVMAAYPKGLDFRDMVWMFKRMLAGLGFVHQQNAVHGAVLPPHVMVHPADHGAFFVDWCYAVRGWQDGIGKVRAFSKPYKDYYAPEVFAKRRVTPATDIYMAAKCAVALLGGDVTTNQMPDTVPRQIQAFLQGCLIENRDRRHDDAWELHEELDELLERLVGPRKYRLLEMPAA